MSVWLRPDGEASLVLCLHVQPGAKTTEFVGLHGEAMKLRLAAPPVDGKANAALIVFLAKFCALPKSAVTLLSGHSARAKRVRLDAVDAALRARLQALG